ncbi:unnamed protein product, partial [Sphacelaria rigidula]
MCRYRACLHLAIMCWLPMDGPMLLKRPRKALELPPTRRNTTGRASVWKASASELVAPQVHDGSGNKRTGYQSIVFPLQGKG